MKKDAKSKKKTQKVCSDDEGQSSDSSLNMSCVSSSINTACSPELLHLKAEKKILKLKKFLKQEQTEESLRSTK